MDLSDKIVLVTGAQQGIGRAIALRCGAASADVAVNWLDDENAANEVAEEIRAGQRRAVTVRADMGRLADVEAMVAAGRAGAIINLTSGAAYRGSPRGAHYCASKGGVVSLTRQMALELAPHRIRVNAIAPGLTDTAQPRYGSSEDEIAAMAQTIPLGRIAQPEDIARTAVFLASDEAGFTTGQILHVNGGGYLG